MPGSVFFSSQFLRSVEGRFFLILCGDIALEFKNPVHPFSVAVIKVAVVDVRLKIKVFGSMSIKRGDFCFFEPVKSQMDDIVKMIELTNLVESDILLDQCKRRDDSTRGFAVHVGVFDSEFLLRIQSFGNGIKDSRKNL